MRRSRHVASLGVALAILCATTAVRAARVVVIGIDGMDPTLLIRFVNEGVMPNFERFIEEGDFKPLQTTVAAQSPVAWSTFITGMDPGGHGIFDFVHRDPATMLPHLSMSQALPAGRTVGLGKWQIPLSGAKVELLREGVAFWELLGKQGVPSTIFRMPVNFPPVEGMRNRSMSGMGTPDILGTPGTFSYYVETLPENARSYSGGRAYKVRVARSHVRAELHGPPNPFRRPGSKDSDRGRSGRKKKTPVECTKPFDVYLDRDSDAAKFVLGDQEFILQVGEWSDWLRVEFDAVPGLVDIHATARFYLKQLSPEFKLYVTPLQMSPIDPPMPISHPSSWSKKICECLGFFYTQELPHDTKAFTHGVFSGREYWDQLMMVHKESRGIFEHLLGDHDDGLLFFYFGSVDQGCHMLWHYTDPDHPGYVEDAFLKDGIRRLYREMDVILGRVRDAIDSETTLIVMSDHGFSPFRRGVNLNTWLWKNGYIAMRGDGSPGSKSLFANVDWQRTQAYALGLNGLYVNLRGRERHGIVSTGGEYQELLDRLEQDLLMLRDPQTSQQAVRRVVRSRRHFRGAHKDEAPDLIIGYNWGFRSSWKSPLGAFPDEVFVDNLQAWSGDHCIDNRLVPGVLISNRRITLEVPGLADLTVAILDEFGVKPLDAMVGKDCLE